MLFSTKAEYGVRLMVELGRQPGSTPISLSAVAEAERLPLSYLEHLVAKLRKAGLVTSTRGAHGGYRLAKPAEEITMDAVVEALEGQIAPMECFHDDARGQSALLARGRRRPRLRDQAALDARAGRRHQGAGRHDAGRAGRVRAAPPPTASAERRSAPPPDPKTSKTRNGVKLAELEIRNLHVSAEDKEILRGLDLDVEKGKVHALMGPNGSGKSTLANAIMGHPGARGDRGLDHLQGRGHHRGRPRRALPAGLFMAFQYPVAIPGVSVSKYLRMVINAHREARGEEQIKIKDFAKVAQEAMALANIPKDFSSRYLNDGFSGGEKKRMELLQLALLRPEIAVLDETDSGLDIDALRTVAEGVNKFAGPEMGVLIITHYQRILHMVKPDSVHVMFEGRIVKEGGPELVGVLEEKGYGWIREEVEAGAAA